MQRRKAFTMIELIFVIVIIGILASIAIPKFAANRNDAEANILVYQAKQVIEKINIYYLAYGYQDFIVATTPEITNIPLYANIDCTTRAKGKFVASTIYLCTNGKKPIMKIGSVDNGRTVTLTEKTATTPVSGLLSQNKAFQHLTNGTLGKTYKIDGF